MGTPLLQSQRRSRAGLGLSAAVHAGALMIWLSLPTADPLPLAPAEPPAPFTLQLETPSIANLPDEPIQEPNPPPRPSSERRAAPAATAASSPTAPATPSSMPTGNPDGATAITGGGTGAEGVGGSGGNVQGDGGAAPVEDPDDGPSWVRKSTPAEQLAVLPPQIVQDRISGTAVLSCFVMRTNRVRGCKIVSETKVHLGFEGFYGFGEAAMRLSRGIRVRPPIRDGQPRYDVRVQIPIAWGWD